MSEPKAITEKTITDLIADRIKVSYATSIFIASTPFPKILWVSLQGSHDEVIEHRSDDDPKPYHITIPVAELTSTVDHYRSRATVTLGMFRYIDNTPNWHTWEISHIQVQEDLATHKVTVEFDLLLDGNAVAAGLFNYTVDLYLGFEATP